MITFNLQDFQELQGESIQSIRNDMSGIRKNLSKTETRVQGNTDRDSELSQKIEVIEKRMEKSSDRITSNTNAVGGLKVSLRKIGFLLSEGRPGRTF